MFSVVCPHCDMPGEAGQMLWHYKRCAGKNLSKNQVEDQGFRWKKSNYPDPPPLHAYGNGVYLGPVQAASRTEAREALLSLVPAARIGILTQQEYDGTAALNHWRRTAMRHGYEQALGSSHA